MNGLELYSVVLTVLERSAMRFGLRREPQKDSCKAAQGKCSFPWDGIGLAHKRQLRFHRAVCKTAISPERCIIAPFILKGFGRCCVRERHAPSLQAPARLQAGGTRFSAVPSPDHRSILPDRPENFPAFRHGCKDDAHALSGSAPTSCVQGSSPGAGKSAAKGSPLLPGPLTRAENGCSASTTRKRNSTTRRKSLSTLRSCYRPMRRPDMQTGQRFGTLWKP